MTGTAYQIKGVTVPNFVYPSYFQQMRGKAPFDKLGMIAEPVACCLDITPKGPV